MELKVWVDGIHRVVCGVTDQTTVQEVVIALAQATGRTGRYTLVERWNSIEKMLPPAIHPLQVLSKYGDQAGNVQFVLRRTGTRSSMSEGEDKVVAPERKTYRSSLPPQLKHKQKKEAILNRKEPKRKSLTMPGEIEANKYKASVATDLRNETVASLDAPGRSTQTLSQQALIPPPYRSRSVTPTRALYLPKKESTSHSDQLMINSLPRPYRSNPSSHQGDPMSPKKKPLLPLHYQGDFHPDVAAGGKDPNYVNRNVRHGPRTSDSSDIVPPVVQGREAEVAPVRPMMHNRLLETAAAKAYTEFTRLVLEQHDHVNEQSQTMKSVDEEIENYLDVIQRRQKNAALLEKEIEDLERTVEANKIAISNEEHIESLLQDEVNKRNSLQNESAKFKMEVSKVTDDIRELESKVVFLEKEIEREKVFQARKKEENARLRYEATEVQVGNISRKLRNSISELKDVEERIKNTEAVISKKQVSLETLHRELRQVNLQQFIRQTGSKVTVLPPDDDKYAVEVDQYTSSTNYDVITQPTAVDCETNSSGVWV